MYILIIDYAFHSIEEDFVTWKEGLWPSVAQYYGIDSSQATQVRRDYELTIHTDLNPTEIFSGEPHKLGSFVLQKPLVNQLILSVCSLSIYQLYIYLSIIHLFILS